MSLAWQNRASLVIFRKKAWLHVALVLFTTASIFRAEPVIGQGFTNLHNFVFTNGTYPLASLILSGSTLYGTAQNYGGGAGGGYGSGVKMGIDGSEFRGLHFFFGGHVRGNLERSLVV